MKSQDCNNIHETHKFKPDKNINTEEKLTQNPTPNQEAIYS